MHCAKTSDSESWATAERRWQYEPLWGRVRLGFELWLKLTKVEAVWHKNLVVVWSRGLFLIVWGRGFIELANNYPHIIQKFGISQKSLFLNHDFFFFLYNRHINNLGNGYYCCKWLMYNSLFTWNGKTPILAAITLVSRWWISFSSSLINHV